MMFSVGVEFKESFTVSEETYNGFVNLFNDRNPLHTDEEFAIARGFKGRVMHGNILNGYLSYFIGECLPDKNVIIHSQEIKFKNAVFLNDTLEFVANVAEVYESVNSVEFKFRFKNQDGLTMAVGKIQIGILK